MPSGGGQHDAADVVLAAAQDVDEGLAIERERQGLADLRIVEGRGRGIDDQIVGDVGRHQLADGLRRLRLDVLEQRDRHVGRERHVELAGHERQDAGRAVLDHLPVDAVEIGLALLPVVRVAHELHRLAALELDELERPRADRIGAHVLGRDVAGIDRGVARGEQRDERGLRPVENEGDLVVAVDRHVLEVVPPDGARVLAEVVLVLAGQLVPGALHVLGRERLAVVPLDALAQLEGQLGLARVPGPALGEVGHDGLGRVQRLLLIEHHQVVEDAHERLHRRDGGLLVDRGAGQVVAMVDAQRAALLLRQRRQRQAGGGE